MMSHVFCIVLCASSKINTMGKVQLGTCTITMVEYFEEQKKSVVSAENDSTLIYMYHKHYTCTLLSNHIGVFEFLKSECDSLFLTSCDFEFLTSLTFVENHGKSNLKRNVK